MLWPRRVGCACILILLASLSIAPAATAQTTEKYLNKIYMMLDLHDTGPLPPVELPGWKEEEAGMPMPSGMYPGLTEIPVTINAMDRTGILPEFGDIFMHLNPDLISGGIVYLDEGPDTAWVESFFDVFVEVELPGPLPGVILVNYEPIHVAGIIDQYPPYYETLSGTPGIPIPVFDKFSGIEMGNLYVWEETVSPWYEPQAHLLVTTAYGSTLEGTSMAVPGDAGIRLQGVVSSIIGEFVELSGNFSFREAGSMEPFVPFAADVTPEAPGASTVNPMGEGDGITVYFEPGSEPFEEHVYEFQVEMAAPPYGVLWDTVTVFVDDYPPIPSFFDIWRDSIPDYPPDSFFDITFKLDHEMTGPGSAELLVFPLQFDWTRDLTEVDQLGLGTDLDSTSCGPAAAASCLKYFADNGHSELDNPDGDESKPDASAEDIARDLQGTMNTNDSTGTTIGDMVGGIESYLNGHGADGWDVDWGSVDDATDLAEMLREFQSDSEDVIILLQDTTASGDTIGHYVTMGSSHFTLAPPSQKIDFMDPWGGGSTEDNNYDVGQNANGEPTTSGYDLNGDGSDAWVAAYVKVSPPETAPAEAPSPLGTGAGRRPSLKAPARAPWLLMAAGPVTGSGIVDTLVLDTSILAPGPHLMEIVTLDDMGLQGRDIRLIWVNDTATGDDEPGPPIKTGIRKSYPNPFNPWTTIEYSLMKKAEVTMVIYDVAGRRIRTLLSGKTMDAGVHREVWDGRDESGTRVASGVYFCRFVAAGQVEARKLIMLR